ncbi:MAG: D-alanine--D-alanine ligase [Pseudomonadota bacterium]|nr:MAG: D-alanine--D-alanine ligase [Pseudomonadota bacterium]
MSVVAVIAGGPSVEAAVSRASARGVSEALSRSGHSPSVIELDADLPSALARSRPDVVFPVTHGALGEDGCLQGLLEVLDLPYVGSGVLASALAASKPHAKVAFRAAGLPLAADAVVARGEDFATRVAEIRRALGRALVVKPADGGSAIGVSVIEDAEPDSAVHQALERALATSPTALVESRVRGIEVTCAVLEEGGRPRALPLVLIRPKLAGFYDFTSKYRAGGSDHVCPAPLSERVTTAIQRAAIDAHRALGCRDLSRVDFIVDEERESFIVLEVNTLPGMTATSLFPEAAAASGIPFEGLCDLLVKNALGRPRRATPKAPEMP